MYIPYNTNKAVITRYTESSLTVIAMEFVGAVLGCLNLFLCFPAVSHLVRLGSVGKNL